MIYTQHVCFSLRFEPTVPSLPVPDSMVSSNQDTNSWEGISKCPTGPTSPWVPVQLKTGLLWDQNLDPRAHWWPWSMMVGHWVELIGKVGQWQNKVRLVYLLVWDCRVTKPFLPTGDLVGSSDLAFLDQFPVNGPRAQVKSQRVQGGDSMFFGKGKNQAALAKNGINARPLEFEVNFIYTFEFCSNDAISSPPEAWW